MNAAEACMRLALLRRRTSAIFSLVRWRVKAIQQVRSLRSRCGLARALCTLGICITAVGCGGKTALNSGDAAVSTTESTLPACTWPALLDRDPGSRDHCHAARRILSCTFTNGLGGEECTTGGEATCPDLSGVPCMDRCALDEYVAACGGIGPSPDQAPDPPPGCKYLFPVPSGPSYYCCPCGS